MYHEPSFHEVSADLFRYRDHLLKVAAEWADFEMLKQPLIVVEGSILPREVPPIPENIREAIAIVEADIARLRRHYMERDARRRAERDGYVYAV